jgi:hypothetical protein
MTDIDSLSDYHAMLANFFRRSVSIVPGAHARRVTVRATIDPAHGAETRAEEPGVPGPPPFDEDLGAFLGAVDAGCFTGALQEPSRVLSQTDVTTSGVVHRTWVIDLMPIPDGAFGCLARMAGQAQHFDLAELSVEEVAPPDAPRMSGDALAPIGTRPVPFAVVNHLESEDERKSMPVLVTFRDEVIPPVFTEVEKLFLAWAKVLQSGGFAPCSWNPYCTGSLTDLSGHLPEEVVANLEFFSGAEEAWNCLALGLLRIHSTAPILSLEIG